MKGFPREEEILPIIALALKEDIGARDITTDAIFTGSEKSGAVIISNEDGIFCGGEVLKFIFGRIDPSVKISVLKSDGKRIKKGEAAARLKGSTKSLLTGERTALNFLQRMSGIATKAGIMSGLLKGTRIKILDTRKTAPGLRLIDKYSVKCGGGQNHRIGLFDMVLIKDNHIQAAGGITEAVKRVRDKYGKKYKIEIEARTPEEAAEAAKCAPDVIMLDNMNRETMKSAIELIKGRARIEVSGNFDEDRIKNIIDLKIDFVSIGALTHSVKAFDLSMKFK